MRHVPKPQRPKTLTYYLDKALEIGSDTADVLVHLGRGVTPVGLAAVGVRAFERYRMYTEQSAYDWLQKGWTQIHVYGLEAFLFTAAAFHDAPQLVQGVDSESGLVTTTLFGEHKLAWIFTDDGVTGPWIPDGIDADKTRTVLGRLVWEHIGSNRAVLTQAGADPDNMTPEVAADEDEDVFPSKLGDELIERAKKFLADGTHRSMVFLGNPGTGKTCLIQYISRQFGGFSLRICAQDFEDLDARQILGIVRLLRPCTVSIDDFDRLEGQDKLLTELEALNRIVQIFMVSVNDIEEIPEAVFRPGRFDERKFISKLSDDVLDHVLNGIEVKPKIRKILCELPIAYVVEFRKRYRALGADEAQKEIRDLVESSHALRWQVERELSNRQTRLRRRMNKKTPRQKLAAERRAAAKFERRMADEEARRDRALERVDKLEAEIVAKEPKATTPKKTAEKASTKRVKKTAKKAASTKRVKKTAKTTTIRNPR